jgi:small-conductance mechanosensitive channel
MTFSTWNQVLNESFQDLSQGLVVFLPKLVFAIIIVFAGWFIGSFILGRLVSRTVSVMKLDDVLRNAGVESFLNKGGFRLDAAAFLGGLVKWFVMVFALIVAFDVLGLGQVNDFLNKVLSYLPQVIVAVLILLAAAVIAEAMQKIVTGAARSAGFASANLLGSVTRWAIWIFAIMAALDHLVVAEPLVQFMQMISTGLVIALALAVGISFGLGGQQAASEYIAKLRRDIGRHDSGN